MITKATKVWEDEFAEALQRHPDAQLIIGNNLKRRFIDIGPTNEFYYKPELEAVKQCDTEYILWYAGDVVEPKTDWISEALKLLKKYPIVSCAPHAVDERDIEVMRGFNITDQLYETYHFSDQCYLARTQYMQDIDYGRDSDIAKDYPFPASFEARVGKWLKTEQTPMAVLRNHQYHHLSKGEK